MQPLTNLTQYFLHQKHQDPTIDQEQLKIFASSLLDPENCGLCTRRYDLERRLPRILVQCGHTFCTDCLHKFFLGRKIRCPLCLRLLKKLQHPEVLPLNHTIYLQLQSQKGIALDRIRNELYARFQENAKEVARKGGRQEVDPNSNLPFCVHHEGRVEHFLCATHGSGVCRECVEICHQRAECKVVDFYRLQANLAIKDSK